MGVPTDTITRDRLARWAGKMQVEHATPLMLIGVGHDHNSGKIVICTLDEAELDREELRAFLLYAIQELDRR